LEPLKVILAYGIGWLVLSTTIPLTLVWEKTAVAKAKTSTIVKNIFFIGQKKLHQISNDEVSNIVIKITRFLDFLAF
jgi:hypothetical protein